MDKKDLLKQVIANNKQIDSNLIRQVEELEKKLREAGVDIKPEYNIQHPLGSLLFDIK
jgi:hypothetical protein